MSRKSKLKIHSTESSLEIVYNAPIQRKVCFSYEDEVYPIATRREIPSEEKCMIWYRRSELKQMRLEDDATSCEEEALAWWEQPLSNDVNHVGCQRKLHRMMAVIIVLDEQDLQKKLGICDPMLISEKYRDYLSRSKVTLFASRLWHDEEKTKANRVRRMGKKSSLGKVDYYATGR